MFDKDGYPTDECLERIRTFNQWDKPYEMVDFLKSVWHWRDFLVHRGRTLGLHTGGWSGNESIIGALRETIWWHLYWQKSTRGGHYWFKLPPKALSKYKCYKAEILNHPEVKLAEIETED